MALGNEKAIKAEIFKAAEEEFNLSRKCMEIRFDEELDACYIAVNPASEDEEIFYCHVTFEDDRWEFDQLDELEEALLL